MSLDSVRYHETGYNVEQALCIGTSVMPCIAGA